MKISNREIIIAAIAILVLLGIGYFINNNSSDNKEETTQEEQVNLDDENKDNENSDEDSQEEKPADVTSTDPKEKAEVALASAPKIIILTTGKELSAGSEIQVVSDKGVDVVTGGNRLSTDLKTLTAPVALTVAGTYSVTYNLNWNDGTKSTGKYTFTVK